MISIGQFSSHIKNSQDFNFQKELHMANQKFGNNVKCPWLPKQEKVSDYEVNEKIFFYVLKYAYMTALQS